MTEPLGKELPHEVQRLLGVGRAKREDVAVILLTTDPSGLPRVCLLSPYQVASSGASSLFLAVYAASKSAGNLQRSKRAMLVVVTPPSFHYVTGRVARVGRSPSTGNLLYSMSVAQVARDYSPRAPIVSTVEFDARNVREFYTSVFREIKGAIKKGRRRRHT